MADEFATDPAAAGLNQAVEKESAPRIFKVADIPDMLLKNRKLLLMAASSLLLLGFISLLLWSTDEPYRTLFANMDEREASAIVEVLQKQQVDYHLEAGGSTITVPADQVYSLRLKLAGQDLLPGGGTGFELFDQSNALGVSDFAQKVNLQRALQGELARTIAVLPHIAVARVHLVMPRESAFVRQQRKATASVMLKLTGANRLPQQTTLAIQNLVAAAVPNLEREDVTVVDSFGHLLTKHDSDGANIAQNFQEYQVRLERNMEQRLTRMLEQIVGEGQCVVRVSADIVRERVEQSSQRFNPDEAVLRHERVVDESRKAMRQQAKGVPGVTSNDPSRKKQGAKGQTPQEEAGHRERDSKFEISSTTEKRVIPFGGVKRLSVAVVVGGRAVKDGEAFQPRDAKELKHIRALVEQAMGFDEDRGDSLEVQSMPLFDKNMAADEAVLQASEDKAFYLDLARYGLAGVALFLLVWFVLRPLSQKFVVREVADESSAERAVRDVGGVERSAAGNGNVRDEPGSLVLRESSAEAVENALNAIEMELGEGDVEQQALRKAVQELLEEDVKMASRIVQQWTRQA